MTTILERYTNTDLEIEGRIAETPKGYSVVLYVLDADEALPSAKIFPYAQPDALAQAQAYAKKIANL